MAPSSDTITGWTIFASGQRIKSAEMLANLAIWRGHLLPFDPTASAAASGSYDLGSTTYGWRKIYGKPQPGVVSTTGSMTLAMTHEVVLMNPSATITATLPTAVGNDRQKLTIKNIGTGGFTVFVDANASELIDGTLTVNLVDRESTTLIALNGNWYQI